MATLKHFDEKTKTLTLEFSNINSLVEYTEQPINECFAGRELSSEREGDWSGTKTYEEAIKFLKFGWEAESEKLSGKLKIAKMNQPITSRRKVYQSVTGYTPIVPNYLMGIPTNMLDSRLTTIKKKVVTLNKDISYSAWYSENAIEDNSVKAFQIVQALEANGTRCNLNIVWGDDLYSAVNVKRILLKVRVKNSSERMNISKTSFPMVNPGMLRRILFRVLETIPELKREDSGICCGYGRPTESKDLKSLVEKQSQYYLNRDIANPIDAAKDFSRKL